MDPDTPWFADDDSNAALADGSTDITAAGSATEQVEDWLATSVTAGPPVPNPYAHIVSVFTSECFLISIVPPLLIQPIMHGIGRVVWIKC